MDSLAPSTRDYHDFVPKTEVVQELDCKTLLISLPGFRKDQLRVQLTPTPTLKISGERPIGGNKWIRFHQEYPVSSNCDKNQISARFDAGILYIRQPTLNTPSAEKDREKVESNAQNPQKHETKSNEETEDEDEFHEARHADEVQKSKEHKKPKNEGAENDIGNPVIKTRVFRGLGGFSIGNRPPISRGLTTDWEKAGKKIGRVMSVVVVLLSAVAIGIYVKNLIPPAKSCEN